MSEPLFKGSGGSTTTRKKRRRQPGARPSPKPTGAKYASPQWLRERQRAILESKQPDPNIKEQAFKLFARGVSSTPVQTVFKALDVGRRDIQRKGIKDISGKPKTTEDIARTGLTIKHPLGKGGKLVVVKPNRKGPDLSDAQRFMLDVVTSPVSYLFGGTGGAGRMAVKTSIGKSAAKHGAQRAVQEAAKKGVTLGEEAATRAGTKYATRLTKPRVVRPAKGNKEAKVLGQTHSQLLQNIAKRDPALYKSLSKNVKGGIQLGTPFGQKRIATLIPGRVTTKITAPISKATQRVFDPLVAGFTPGHRAARGGYAAMVARQEGKKGTQAARNLAAKLLPVIDDAERAFKKNSDEFEEVYKGNKAPKNKHQAEAAPRVLDTMEELFQEAEKAGMDIGHLEKFLPLVLSKKARGALGYGTTPSIYPAGSKAAQALSRRLTRGYDPDLTIKGVNQAVREKNPDFDFLDEIFSEDDTFHNLRTYVRSMAKKVESHRRADRLMRMGVLRHDVLETVSGLDNNSLRLAGFAKPDEAVNAATFTPTDPRLKALADQDPDQFTRLTKVSAARLAESRELSKKKAKSELKKLNTLDKKFFYNQRRIEQVQAAAPKPKKVPADLRRRIERDQAFLDQARITLGPKKTLYHGTAQPYAKQIRKEGFKGSPQDNLVWMTPHEKEARGFAESKWGTGRAERHRSKTAVVKLNVPEHLARYDPTSPREAVSRGWTGWGTKAAPLTPEEATRYLKEPTVEQVRKVSERLKNNLKKAKEIHDTSLAASEKEIKARQQRRLKELFTKAEELTTKSYHVKDRAKLLERGIDPEKGTPWPLSDGALKNLPRGWKEDLETIQGAAMPAFNGKKAPREFVEEIKATMSDPRQLDSFIRFMEKFQNAFRKGVTIPWLAFHNINLIGGTFVNWIGGAGSLHHTVAERILKGTGGKHRYKMFGNMTGEEIREALAEIGVLKGGGLTRAQEFADPLKRGTGWLGAKGKYNPLRTPAVLAEMIENRLRTAAFLRGLEKFGDVDSAAEFVFYRHGDYSDLTKLERGVRGLLPFYKWARTNVAFQVQQIIEQPGKYQKFARFREALKDPGDEDPYENPPSVFEEEQLTLPVPGTDYSFSPRLPLTDINEWGAPLKEFPQGLRKPLGQTYLGNLISAANEINSFTGRPTKWVFPTPTQRAMVEAFRHIPATKHNFKIVKGGEVQVNEALINALSVLNPAARIPSFEKQVAGQPGAEPPTDVQKRAAWAGIRLYKKNPEIARYVAAKELEKLDELIPKEYRTMRKITVPNWDNPDIKKRKKRARTRAPQRSSEPLFR